MTRVEHTDLMQLAIIARDQFIFTKYFEPTPEKNLPKYPEYIIMYNQLIWVKLV